MEIMKNFEPLSSSRACEAVQFGAPGIVDAGVDCAGMPECELRPVEAVAETEMPAAALPFSLPSEKSASVAEDEDLVRECLLGDQRAWERMINKYRRLIHSISFKYRATGEDAEDICQSVCIELFSSLPRLRSPGALRSWLITVTIHQSLHWKRKKGNTLELDAMEPNAVEEIAIAPEIVAAFEREQDMREAMSRLPPRAAELLRMLFMEQPQVSYAEAARRLGLAEGSIGFIRGRALEKLRRILVNEGFC